MTTLQDKDAEQDVLVGRIFKASAKNDMPSMKQAVEELADLREEQPLAVALTLFNRLDEENRKLIEENTIKKLTTNG